MANPRQRPDILARAFDAEVVLMDPRTDAVHSLNHTAHVVWALCDGTRTLDQVVSGVAERYGVPAADVEKDVAATVDRLASLGLLESSGSR